MNRAASTVLLLASVALLATRLVSPAASAPQARAADPSVAEEALPGLTEVNAEVNRLRERLSAPSELPPPVRNPFNFGHAPERMASEPVKVVSPPAPAPAPRPLPHLVAILSNASSGAPSRTAVFAAGDDVEFKVAGDDIGAFRVESVGADGIVLVERASSASFNLSLH